MDTKLLIPLELHVADCKTCQSQYSDILPFIFRDTDQVKNIDEGITVTLNNERILREKQKNELKKHRIHAWSIGLGALLTAGILAFLFLQVYDFSSKNNFLADKDTIEMAFSIEAPGAKSVWLVGDFTDWIKQKVELQKKSGSGVWTGKVRLRRGGVFKYNFIIDGTEWKTDPHAELQVPDGFGGENSVIRMEY